MRNSIAALTVNIITLILQFFSRKVFLNYLGTEVLGLNTTAMNLLQFLNLAELGIGGAVAFTLYKPLFDKNEEEIKEIINLQGLIYRRIGLSIIAGSLLLMCFFPLIFSKMELPLWYAYSSFGVLLFSSLLSYFVNYREILLSADQKEYVIQGSYKIAMLIKVLFQMMSMIYLTHPYIWWLLWETVFAIIGSIWLNMKIRHHYTFLRKGDKTYSELKKKYSYIITKVKQVFFHKIAAFALFQSSPLIIYAYTTLTMVALYGNYMVVIGGIILLVNSVFNGLVGSIGNLLAEGNISRSLKVFYELFFVRFTLVCAVTYSTYLLLPDWIILWLGKKYLLPESTLILLCSIMFINLARSTVDSFIWGYGMYQDTWAPIAETLLNVGFSVLFGAFWGLNGVLLGVLTSLVIIVCGWKPYFLFSSGFKCSQKKYWITLAKYVVCFGLSCLLSGMMLHSLKIGNYLDFILKAVATFMLNIAIMSVLLLCFKDNGLIYFAKRIQWAVIKQK